MLAPEARVVVPRLLLVPELRGGVEERVGVELREDPREPVERGGVDEPREEEPRDPWVELREREDDPRDPCVELLREGGDEERVTEPREEDPELRLAELREDRRDPWVELRDPEEEEPRELPAELRDDEPRELWAELREPEERDEELREAPRELPRDWGAIAMPVSPSRVSGPSPPGSRWAEAALAVKARAAEIRMADRVIRRMMESSGLPGSECRRGGLTRF